LRTAFTCRGCGSGLPGRAWLVPGRRRRVLVISLGAALILLAYVGVVTTVLFETGR